MASKSTFKLSQFSLTYREVNQIQTGFIVKCAICN